MANYEIPDWTVEEFMETALGEAACRMEDRMDMALGEEFLIGNVADKLDLLFEGLAEMSEIAYYCARVSEIYTDDVMHGRVAVHGALQGAVSQAICLGILLERGRGG